MTEEKLKQYIEGQRSSRTTEPFKVPEGYFDTLCDRVMSQLPEQQQTIRRTLIPRAWRYAAAAVVVGVVACVGVLIPHLNKRSSTQLAQDQSEVETAERMAMDEEYFNDVLDYSMLNNNDIAYYLTEN